jgi:hypothetical protein
VFESTNPHSSSLTLAGTYSGVTGATSSSTCSACIAGTCVSTCPCLIRVRVLASLVYSHLFLMSCLVDFHHDLIPLCFSLPRCFLHTFPLFLVSSFVLLKILAVQREGRGGRVRFGFQMHRSLPLLLSLPLLPLCSLLEKNSDFGSISSKINAFSPRSSSQGATVQRVLRQ